MTCPLHTAPQSFCGICAVSTAAERNALRKTIVGAGKPSPSHDAQAARIAGLEANVNEKLATIAALESQLASESRAVLAARISALATALRKSLADVDPKAMSTYEQQQARREARALLEEVA